jgi:hypothetical protein
MATAPQTTQLALKVRLSRRAGKKLVQQAERAHRPLDDYASELLEQAVAAPDVDAILAPLRKEFARSGTSDQQLIGQINQARDQYHASRRRPK